MNRGTRRGEEGKREREREVESQRGKIDRWIKPNRREAYRSFDSQSGFCWTTWHTRWLVFQGRNEPRSRHDDRDKIGRNDDGASPPHPATILRTNKSRVYAMLRKTPDDNQRPPPVVLALMVSPFRGHGEKSLSLSISHLNLSSKYEARHDSRNNTIFRRIEFLLSVVEPFVVGFLCMEKWKRMEVSRFVDS